MSVKLSIIKVCKILHWRSASRLRTMNDFSICLPAFITLCLHRKGTNSTSIMNTTHGQGMHKTLEVINAKSAWLVAEWKFDVRDIFYIIEFNMKKGKAERIRAGSSIFFHLVLPFKSFSSSETDNLTITEPYPTSKNKAMSQLKIYICLTFWCSL